MSSLKDLSLSSAGLLGADCPPCGHHRPHQFLLAGQLRPGWVSDHAGARCRRLSNGGTKTRQHVPEAADGVVLLIKIIFSEITTISLLFPDFDF